MVDADGRLTILLSAELDSCVCGTIKASQWIGKVLA